MGGEPLILLDTHAWLWWVGDPELLSQNARRGIEEAEQIGVSVISCWELAMLTQKKRLNLDRDVLEWVRQALAKPRVKLLELGPEIAVTAAGLEAFHSDPADRMIVATALIYRVPIVTKDALIRSYDRVRTIW